MKRRVVLEIISFLFVLLFSYAALAKLFDFEKFRIQIGQSPLLTGLGPVVPALVIGTELALVLCFALVRFRLIAFYGAFSLMTMFTAYILFILTLSSYIPCSCGGVLEKLSWTQHLIFNGVFTALALAGIVLQMREGRSQSDTTYSSRSHSNRAAGLYIGMTLLFSVGVVAVLYGVSSDIRKQPGTFLRVFPPHPIMEQESISLPQATYYFAGAAGDHVYLANQSSPRHVLRIRKDFHDTTHLFLSLDHAGKLRYFRIRVAIDSPYIFFMDGAIPFIYRGLLSDMKATAILHDSLYFTTAVPFASASFGLQAVRAKNRENILATRNLKNPKPILGHGLLETQGTNFSTDGILHYNRALQQFIFVYYYRNEYFITDTSLQLNYRAHTLDTFRTVQIQSDTVHSERSVTLSAPPPTINHCVASYGRWLLIHSLAAARNENLKRFERGSVLDVYDLQSGDYTFSFYIDSKNKKHFTDMLVVGDHLFVLFDTLLVRYDFMGHYFTPTAQRY